MKYIVLLAVLFGANFSYAANVAFDSACQEKIAQVLDRSVGQYYTENELDYDNLEIVVFPVKQIDAGYEYRVEFDGTNGWLAFSKDCQRAVASFIFKDYELDL